MAHCGAKLVLPRDTGVWHASGFCNQAPLAGKFRCARHGGSNTGARTREGAAAQAKGMREGRLRWIAQMKENGLPLPFAGFKPKGSGVTREARAEIRAARARERQLYSESKKAAGEARQLVHTVRALAPRYVRRDYRTHPKTMARMSAVADCYTALHAIAPTGPFAREIASMQLKAATATLRLSYDALAIDERAERAERFREECERQGERNMMLWRQASEQRAREREAYEATMAAKAEAVREVVCEPVEAKRPACMLPAMPAPKHIEMPDRSARVYGGQRSHAASAWEWEKPTTPHAIL